MFRHRFLLALPALVFLSIGAFAQDKKAADNTEKGKYKDIEVATFDVKEGVTVPEDFLKSLSATVVIELQKIKKFNQVSAEGSAPATTGEPTLRLTGTVTKFKAGSRTKRYLVGFGAGKSKVIAHVKFVDRETGNVLWEQDVDGDVVMGLFGGDSGGATRELAEAVAKSAKKRFF